jgi:hypothetical protein
MKDARRLTQKNKKQTQNPQGAQNVTPVLSRITWNGGKFKYLPEL